MEHLEPPYDYVVCSDVIYNTTDFCSADTPPTALVDTIAALKHSTDSTVLLCQQKRHHMAEITFFKSAAKLFDITSTPANELAPYRANPAKDLEDIRLHVMASKSVDLLKGRLSAE